MWTTICSPTRSGRKQNCFKLFDVLFSWFKLFFKNNNNKIEETPPELSKCLALKELDLSGNNTRNLPSELQTNVAMTLWLMSRELKQRTNVRQLEQATAELEDSARLQDEKRIELEDKIKSVSAERDKLERDMPHDYLRWQAKFEGCKSKVCAIQWRAKIQ